MIALPAADHLMAPGLPNFHLILARKFQSGFDGFRTAAGKVDAAALKILAREID